MIFQNYIQIDKLWGKKRGGGIEIVNLFRLFFNPCRGDELFSENLQN